MRNGLNPTQALILGSLHFEDLSSAQIVAIGAEAGEWWNQSRSQVYREIPTLETRGYIITIKDNVPIYYKELYQITEQGRQAYTDWRDKTPAPDLLRNPWMLRLVLSQYDGTGTARVTQEAAEYYRKMRIHLDLEPEHLGSDVLIDYYTLMENWFNNRGK